jgi:dihydroneopterin aldolase
MRRVFLRDMVLTASVGVHAFEHAASQRIRINLDLEVSEQGGAAEGPDELSRVVDYEAVAKRVRAIVGAGHVRLLETLAERLAACCLEDARVRAVWVRIEKLDIFDDMASVGVEILRQGASR